MKDLFEVKALFYSHGQYKLRKYLEIKRRSIEIASPDLLVIMMNPGSSRPEEGFAENILVDTVYDTTQTRIAKVMKRCGFSYCRVLNLSDLREASAKKFCENLKELNSQYPEHCIFHRNREDELSTLFVAGVPVIKAWGVNKKLTDLAKLADGFLRNSDARTVGMQKSNSCLYYHPLPRNPKKQREWAEFICSSLNNGSYNAELS